MTQSSTDFTQIHHATSEKEKEAAAAAATASSQPPATQTVTSLANNQNCDILLGNFQIKKKRYRVLLNYDHIVWERLKTKRSADIDAECHLKQGAVYGKNTNVLHINELIRVSKGNTKSAALHIEAPQPLAAEFGGHTTAEQHSSNTPPTEQYLVLWYAERLIHSATDCNRWDVHKLVLYNADAYIVRQWHALLNKMLTNTAPMRLRARRLLVFINPYGGRKRGLHVYERHCKPLFQLAGIDASCIISQRSNQIRDILLSHDLTPFDAVCCVGGDGTVAEVINGLIFRGICDAGLDARQPPYVPKPALPIAIIPAGSTDTVAYSLHGTSDVRTAAIHLILGQHRGMDVCSVRNREGIIRFCASTLSYGYLGDVAARSERYRWMGTKRYEFVGAKTFLKNIGYEAELSMLQPIRESNISVEVEANETEETRASVESTICCANCTRCEAATVQEAAQASKRAMLKKAILAGIVAPALNSDDELPSSSNASLKSCEDYIDESAVNTQVFDMHTDSNVCMNNEPVKNINLKSCDKKSDVASEVAATYVEEAHATTKNVAENQWKTVHGKFFMISGANITCACTRSPNGVARYSHLGDGYLDLILVRKTTLFNNIRLLLNLTGHNGDVRTLPFVETYRTKRFSFRSPNANLEDVYSIRGSCQPIAESAEGYVDQDDNLSRWNCDGEVIHDQELTMISHCQLINVFMRGPHIYNKPLKGDKKSSLLCGCCGCCKSDD